MGQYYMALVKDNDKQMVFCPQNAVYITKNGIANSEDIGEHSWSDRGPNSWYDNFSGLKLMEHSWLENEFVNGVLEAIWDSPARVAWVGDYADKPYDFDEKYTMDDYIAVWGEGKQPEVPFDQVPTVHTAGYLVNHDRGQYVDLEEYVKVSSFMPKWDNGNMWTIHPLSLLTAIGNGRGGGDYHGTNMDMVGAWAMDWLSFTETKPNGMTQLAVKFIES